MSDLARSTLGALILRLLLRLDGLMGGPAEGPEELQDGRSPTGEGQDMDEDQRGEMK